MTAEEGSSRECAYGLCCNSDLSHATSRLLEVSDSNVDTQKTDSFEMESFLEALDKPEQSESSDQKKRNTGTDSGNDYVFTHLNDPAKYMQRYRYYHTVDDAGQCNTDPKALRHELNAAYSDDSHSTKSFPSLASGQSCTQDIRNRLMKSRLSVSEMSARTIKRNQSGLSSQKSTKRVYLTWEQYVAMCESDAPSPQNQFHRTGSSLVSEETEQTTNGLGKDSPGVPLRKPCINMNSLLPRKDSVTSGYQMSTGSEPDYSLKARPKSELGLSDTQKKKSQITSSKSVEKSNNSFRTLGTLRKSKQQAKLCTEGGAICQAYRKPTSLPGHPEQSVSTVSGAKITLQQPPKTPVGQSCRNVRVSVVYKYTKGRRKQIHL